MAAMAPTVTTLTTKVDSGSPYQLDAPQVLKASNALLSHIRSEAKRKQAATQTKNLLAADDSSNEDDDVNIEPVWLNITTKKHIVDKTRLKPGKILLPHSLNLSTTTTVCLITPDPQRSFKDAIANPAFPTALSSKITRVIDIPHLKARCKSFEQRRQLLAEHDVFLADDRVITILPRILGKVFYSGPKRPIPVNLQAPRAKDAEGKRTPTVKGSAKSIGPPPQLGKEIERTLACAQVHLAPGTSTAIRVAMSNFSPEQLAANIEAVVEGMEKRFITKGWRNIKAIHIKGPTTMALPIWLADELWLEAQDILEEDEVNEAATFATQKGRKRKGREDDEVKQESKAPSAIAEKKQKTLQVREKKSPLKKIEDADLGTEMAQRRQKLRQAKKEAREHAEGIVAVPEAGTTNPIAAEQKVKVKVKSKKVKKTAAVPVAA